MANYANLKAAINANIKTNDNEEITGAILNAQLIAMVNSLGAGYQFLGTAVPATSLGTPDQKVFWFATEVGDYTNGLSVAASDGLVVFYYDSSWHKMTPGVASADQLTELGQIISDPIWVRVVVDSNNRILYGVKTDGKFYFGAGCPPQVVDYISNILGSYNATDYSKVITFLGALIDGDTLNTLLNAKVDKIEGKGLSANDYTDANKDVVNTFVLTNDPIWLQITTDSQDRILEGIKKDGTKYIAKYDADIKQVLAEVPDYNFIKKQEDVKVEGKLIPYTRTTPTEEIDYNTAYNLLTLAFMTDTHIDLGDTEASYANVLDTINFLNNTKVPITALLEGGDVITPAFLSKQGWKDVITAFFSQVPKSKIPLLYTKGNHDLNAIGAIPANSISNDDDWSSLYFDYAEQNYGIVRNLKSNGKKSGYYYYDIPAYKVRIIVANCYDIDFSIRKQDNTVNYYPGSSDYIANEQFNWMASTALNFDDKDEKDWGVIVMMHNYVASDVNGTNQEPIFESSIRKFNTMLDAFNNQTTFDTEYTFQHSWFDLDVHADWTRYANIDDKPYLICVLCGHLHADLNYNYSGVQCIKTANQFCGETSTDRRVRRIAGTSTQNLFDLFTFDLVHKKIRAIRYGAGDNCWGDKGDRFLPDGLSF